MSQSLRMAASVLVLASALLVGHFRHSGEAVPIRRSFDSFPTTIGGWRAQQGEILDLSVLDKLKATDYLMRRDQDPAGRSVWLFVGYWGSQRNRAQPHSPKNCLPGQGWEPIEASKIAIPLPGPFSSITVNRYLLQKDRDRLLVFYWYQSQGEAVAGELDAKIALVKHSITRHRTDGALVRVSSPIYGSVQETSDLLVGYVEALYPVLGEFLPD